MYVMTITNNKKAAPVAEDPANRTVGGQAATGQVGGRRLPVNTRQSGLTKLTKQYRHFVYTCITYGESTDGL
eukprot:SAG11_NODE_24417_length_373_cov_1.441606_1_plen_71_part_10